MPPKELTGKKDFIASCAFQGKEGLKFNVFPVILRENKI